MHHKIALRQVNFLTFFLSRSLFLLFALPYLLEIVQNDLLIVIPLGTILGLIPLGIYFILWKKEPHQNIFEKIDTFFSKPFSLLFRIILWISLLFISCFLVFYITSYINYSLVPQISLMIITITFLGVIYNLATKGIETIARTGEILFFIFILLFVITLIGVIPLIDIDQVRPFFIHSTSRILKASIQYAFFVTTPLFLLFALPQDIVVEKKHKKAILKSYLLASLFIWIITFLTISILGNQFALFYQYPTTLLLRKVTFLKIIERLEIILSVHFLFDLFLLMALLFLLLKEGIKNIFGITEKKKMNKALLLASIFILFGSNYIPPIIPYYGAMTIIVTIFIPILLIIRQKIRKS